MRKHETSCIHVHLPNVTKMWRFLLFCRTTADSIKRATTVCKRSFEVIFQHALQRPSLCININEKRKLNKCFGLIIIWELQNGIHSIIELTVLRMNTPSCWFVHCIIRYIIIIQHLVIQTMQTFGHCTDLSHVKMIEQYWSCIYIMLLNIDKNKNHLYFITSM